MCMCVCLGRGGGRRLGLFILAIVAPAGFSRIGLDRYLKTNE